MLQKLSSDANAADVFNGTNSVLRNTYLLLALSMIPTALGAVVGVATHLSALMSSFVGFIVYMAVAYGFMWAIEKNKNSSAGVAWMMGFTFFMGLMLSSILTHTMRFSNGAQLIALAFIGTAFMLWGLAGIAATTKKDFSNLGKWAFMALLTIIVVSVANLFLKLPYVHLAISIAAMLVFSAFLLYDVQKVVNGGEKNYISATLAIYLDVYNIFTSLLSILGFAGGRRD